MLGDLQLMTTSMCDGLQCIHHSWPRASSLCCLSEGRTQLCSYSQSRAHCPTTWPGHMGVSVCARASLAGQLLDVTHLSPLVRCAGVFHSYCLPRWHPLPCQFLIDTVSSQLMRPLAGWSGPGGPHLCSLGGIAEGVRHTWCSEASMQTAVSSYQAWLHWKVYYSPGKSYAQFWSTYLVSKLHIKVGAFQLLW